MAIDKVPLSSTRTTIIKTSRTAKIFYNPEKHKTHASIYRRSDTIINDVDHIFSTKKLLGDSDSGARLEESLQ
ncbi:7991_t:CDS:2, partial [Entrophospora sp. SA101]